MKRILIISILTLSLLKASTLLLDDRVFSDKNATEIVLFFNSPYSLKIEKKIYNNRIVVNLKDIKIEKEIFKEINSTTIKNYKIYQKRDGIEMVIATKNAKNLKIFRDDKDFKIKIKISSIYSKKNQNRGEIKIIYDNSPNLFLIIISILLLLIIVYLIYREKKGERKEEYEDFKIISQKKLDRDNRISLILFKGREYLILTGNSTLLLNGEENENRDFKEMIEKYKRVNS